jgi:hypothetical protein
MQTNCIYRATTFRQDAAKITCARAQMDSRACGPQPRLLAHLRTVVHSLSRRGEGQGGHEANTWVTFWSQDMGDSILVKRACFLRSCREGWGPAICRIFYEILRTVYSLTLLPIAKSGRNPKNSSTMRNPLRNAPVTEINAH